MENRAPYFISKSNMRHNLKMQRALLAEIKLSPKVMDRAGKEIDRIVDSHDFAFLLTLADEALCHREKVAASCA